MVTFPFPWKAFSPSILCLRIALKSSLWPLWIVQNVREYKKMNTRAKDKQQESILLLIPSKIYFRENQLFLLPWKVKWLETRKREDKKANKTLAGLVKAGLT